MEIYIKFCYNAQDYLIKKQKRVLIQYSLGLFLVLGLAILIVTSLLQYKINEVKKVNCLKVNKI